MDPKISAIVLRRQSGGDRAGGVGAREVVQRGRTRIVAVLDSWKGA